MTTDKEAVDKETVEEREYRVASVRAMWNEIDVAASGGLVDPRVMLEAGDRLSDMLMRGRLTAQMLGRVIRISVRLHIAANPNAGLESIMGIIIAGYTGLDGRARQDYIESLRAMSTTALSGGGSESEGA